MNFNDILKRIRTWMLPIAMVIGSIFYEYLSKLSLFTPYLLTIILILTFSKLAPSDLRLKSSYFKLMVIQIVISVGIYFAILPFSEIVAQGAMICIITPTATTAPVMTKLLKGDVGYVTTYLLLSNVVMAFIIPLFFSITTENNISIVSSFLEIINKIWIVLLFPLFFAWTIRYTAPKIQKQVEKRSHYSFYCWALALSVTTASTVKHFITSKEDNSLILILLLISAIISVTMFLLGSRIGQRYNNRVAITQSLGQKNTILAIWMSHDFLNPTSSIAPIGYVIFQNLINSFQIWIKGKKSDKNEDK